jgi:hypothetical protein
MRFLIIISLSLFLFSCNAITNVEEIINPEKFSFAIDSTSDINCYHIFFQNVNDKTKNFGLNKFDKNDFETDVFPGIYNIYLYGLVDKTDTTKKVSTYLSLKNVSLKNKDKSIISLKPMILEPKFFLEPAENKYILKVDLTGIYEMFYVSSISVKQGQDKVKSIDFFSDSVNENYYCEITYYQTGIWYANISLGLKNKIDEKELNKDCLSISTNYFSNIYLGEY